MLSFFDGNCGFRRNYVVCEWCFVKAMYARLCIARLPGDSREDSSVVIRLILGIESMWKEFTSVSRHTFRLRGSLGIGDFEGVDARRHYDYYQTWYC